MSCSSSSDEQFGYLRIPLEDIVSATNNFSDANLIRESALKKAYKGQLLRSEEQIDIVAERLHGDKNDMFWAEISMLSRFKHENAVSVFGLCGEKEEKIIIYKLKAKGSLDTFLRDPDLTWERRLEICIGVASVLKKQFKLRLIHRNITSFNILLDDNWKPKLFGFEHSLSACDESVNQYVPGTKGYIDPTYEKTRRLRFQHDLYSFGVVLFEVVCGRRAYVPSAADHFAKQTSKHEGPETSTQQRPDDDLLAPLAKFYYEAGKLDHLVDPDLLKEMDRQSFHIFSDTAYSCLKEEPSKDTNIYMICKRLKESLDLQRRDEKPTKLKLLKIGFSDIELATDRFSKTNMIGSGGFGTVYKATLKHYDNRITMLSDEASMLYLPKIKSIVAIKCIKEKGGEEGFSAEIKMLGSCKHRNIVSLLGFCDEGSQKILVYEYVSRGSLDNYLEMTNGMKNFKWTQRLQMCLDIAQGLKYLHTKMKIIHRDIKSANILFNDNWVAKIADFGLSKIGPVNQEVSYLDTRVAGTNVYLDPEYEKTNELRKASDTYSFGVVLFEIMSGTLAYERRYTKEYEKGLAPFVRHQYIQKGTVKDMLDPNLKEELDEGPNQDSLNIFFDIAYQCLAETATQRPNIETVVQKLKEAIHSQNDGKSKHQISLGAIKLATHNFSEKNSIGRGGFGRFYKGKTTNAEGNHTHIAIQRLDTGGGGEETAFWTELEILTKYRHENVVGVLGYCDESDEKIIVYEYTSRGSLARHLKDTNLTWKQRLQICIDVASGLYFLQGGGQGEEFVIHGDIRSSKILLTQDWKPKLFDFGFSVLTHNKNREFVKDKRHFIKDPKYVDPDYHKLGLRKESDIYSFAILIMEIFAGELYTEIRTKVYSSFAEVMFKGIRKEIAPKSLTTFGTLLMECVSRILPRPTISEVLQKIKQTLEFQVDYEIWNPKLPNDCEQLIKMSNSPEDYKTEKEKDLYNMFIKGILLQESKMLFTLGNNGERNLMVSAKTFSYHALHRWRFIQESRFLETPEMLDILNLKIGINTRTQLLTPKVDYGVYLVFKFSEPKIISRKPLYVNLKYEDGSKTSHAYFATWRDNEWMMIELVRFLNDNEDKDFEFLLESFSQCNCGDSTIYVEGIEFRPIVQVNYEETGELEKVQQILKSDLDMDLLQKLPTNYREILMRIENDDGGEELYWLREVNGKKYLMLSTKATISNYCDVKIFKTTSSYQSRFPEVIELLPQQVFRINCAIKSMMLSRDIDYACYLVFRLSEKCHGLHYPIKVRELLHSTNKETGIIYFRSPSPWNLHDTHQSPEQRDDGWMEVRVWKFNLNHEFKDDYLHVNMRLISCEETMFGLIVCGFEFRPM